MLLVTTNNFKGVEVMLENRCINGNSTECSCLTRFCVNRVIAVLAIILALLVGAIVGAFIAAGIIAAIVPLVIFAVGILLAIVLILVFFGCRCRRYNND